MLRQITAVLSANVNRDLSPKIPSRTGKCGTGHGDALWVILAKEKRLTVCLPTAFLDMIFD